MNLYKVPMDVFIWANDPSDAADKAIEEMAYLCGLDNDLTAVATTPDAGVTLEEKGDDTE